MKLPLGLLFCSALMAQTITFSHIVVIVQENRTPDNLFFGLCHAPYNRSCSTNPTGSQYNIQTSNWSNKLVPSHVSQPTPLPINPGWGPQHGHSNFQQMCDLNSKTGQCRMDGAGLISCPACTPNAGFTYVDNSTGTLNPYFDLATQYGWANYMFQTNQGPSFPAHQFIFGGTSALSATGDSMGVFMSGNPAGLSSCAATSNTTVSVILPTGTTVAYPCGDHETVPDILPTSRTWAYYSPPTGESLWVAPLAISHLCQSTGPGGKCTGLSNNVRPSSQVLTDIQKCQLASAVWVIPSGQNSDHAVLNDGGGPSWVASIVNAIGSSACDGRGYWQDTAIIITWDDWGGWYDHVAPTILPEPQGDFQYGFRVPLLVVSAYTPAGFIDNQNRYDFGSIIRTMENNFGVSEGALTFADARTGVDLSAFFTLKTARPFTSIAAAKPASFFVNDKRPALDPDDDGDDN